LIVSIALTSRCEKGCPFCYASSIRAGTTRWEYQELVDFVSDLDLHDVFSVTLGGGEPTLWEDRCAGKDFYDLTGELTTRVSLSLTFTMSGFPELDYNRLPNIPLRLSCHTPGEAPVIVERAKKCLASFSTRAGTTRGRVGINLLLWRSKFAECRRAVDRFLAEGFDDLLLLTLQPAGFGVAFEDECLDQREVAMFLKEWPTNSVRLTACQTPPDGIAS
jgi:hypothetical protein